MADDTPRDLRITVVKPAQRGRPRGSVRVDEPHTRVSSWVEVKHYNQLVRLAKHRDQSVSALVRDLLKLYDR